MNVRNETYKILCNVVAWVEVNRLLRPQWVKENFSSLMIQSCKVFRDHPELNFYHWNSIFKSKQMTTRFNNDGKLELVRFHCFGLPQLQDGFLDELNLGLRDALIKITDEGLPSSVTDVLIDRLSRVKNLGYQETSNVVVIDMRKLDKISFKTTI